MYNGELKNVTVSPYVDEETSEPRLTVTMDLSLRQAQDDNQTALMEDIRSAVTEVVKTVAVEVQKDVDSGTKVFNSVTAETQKDVDAESA